MIEVLLIAIAVFAVVAIFGLLIRKNTVQWESLDFGPPAKDPAEPRKRLNGQL